MTDRIDKDAMERLKFISTSIMETLGQIRPHLIAAREMAHQAGEIVKGDSDEDAADRIGDLGWLVQWASDMDGGDLRILLDIAVMLGQLDRKKERPELKEPWHWGDRVQ
jgi:hypothetical protein